MTTFEELGPETFYVIADFENDIYHYWNDVDENSDETLSYEDSFRYTIGGNLLNFINYADCTVDDILDISVSEDNQYSFKFFREYTSESGKNISDMFNVVIKDNLIIKAERYSVIEDPEANSENKIRSEYVCAEFNYDNNFDNFVQKHNSLLGQ
jgi:hypothetical protein